MRIVSEAEFSTEIREALDGLMFAIPESFAPGSVTGPGRSGAVAAVYASHILGVPYIPYGHAPPPLLGRVLIIDTASESGATLRKAASKYQRLDAYGREPVILAVYNESDPDVGRMLIRLTPTEARS